MHRRLPRLPGRGQRHGGGYRQASAGFWLPRADDVMARRRHVDDRADGMRIEGGTARFCDAMIAIRAEIASIAAGRMDKADNPLKHAPHTAREVTADVWNHAYSREQAAFPLPFVAAAKYWPPVKRVDNVYGDRNLVCTCAPLEAYAEAAD